MREPFPVGDAELNKSYVILDFSTFSLYGNGVPLEVLRSLTDEDMHAMCHLLISWLDTPRMTDGIHWITSAYLSGKGWSWEYNDEDDVSITKRPSKQKGTPDGTLD